MTIKEIENKINMLEKDLEALKKSATHNESLLEEIVVILKGTPKYGGITGLLDRQEADDVFRQMLSEEFVALRTDVNKKLDEVIEHKIRPIVLELNKLKEFRTVWETLGTITKSARIRWFLFFVALGIIGVFIFIKYEFLKYLVK